MTEIYLIRHAQAEGNVFRMMQGQWDGDVTRLGLKQIDALAERFRDVHIDAVYSSDLYRTRITASAITRFHDVPFCTTKALREIDMGPWETRYFGDVIHESPEMARNFMTDPGNWRVEGAETCEQVADRVCPELRRIAEKHPGQAVAAVSHGMAIRCALAKISGMQISDMSQLPICGNTSVTKLIWENGSFRIDYFNDCSHTEKLGLAAWAQNSNLRGEIYDPLEDREWYLKCYEDAWINAHGSSRGFSPMIYAQSAAEHLREEPDAVQCMYDGDEAVGVVDMDTRRGEAAGYGWLSFLYLKPEYRNKGYGVQLLARPIFKYRDLGRRSLRLHVAEDNTAALKFYRKYGFKVLSWENTPTGKLLLMEKKLGGSRDER